MSANLPNCACMTDREHLTLIFNHERKKRDQQFRQDSASRKYEYLKSIFSSDPNLCEMERILKDKDIINLLDKMLYGHCDFCIENARQISSESWTLEQAELAAWSFFDQFRKEVPDIFGDGGSIMTDALKYFDVRIKGRIAERLAIAKHDWPAPDNPAPEHGTKRKTVGNMLPPAELKKWWNGLGAGRDSMTQADLWAKVREKFPSNSITRDRIRALTKGRKPGPKPQFRRKATA